MNTQQKANLTLEESQSNANETINNVLICEETIVKSEDFELVKLEGAYTAVRQKNEWSLAVGNYRLNEDPFKTLDEVRTDSQRTDITRITELIEILIELNKKANE